MIHATATRVQEHTPEYVNERIRRQTELNIARYKDSSPDQIERRLDDLDEEWDVERALLANFAAVVLLGVGLSAVVSRKWLALPFVSGAFMVLHTLKGWCPPLPVFRRLGFRTQAEIDEERFALTCDRKELSGRQSVANEALRDRLFPL